MEYKRLGEIEYRLMCIIWDNEPLGSMQLVKLCAAEFDWKKSTTFTMLKRLCEKELVRNEASVVTALVPREMVQRRESESFMQQTFEGSLPGFLVSFLGGKTISDEEAEELKKLIDSHRKPQ